MKVKPKKNDWDPESTPTFWINHASRLIMRDFERSLRPLDFGMAYIPVASALEQHGALLQKDLADYARVEQPTMASLLVRMERDGLVAREPHPDDKRATLISLTQKAKSRLPMARERMREVASRATEGISESGRKSLIAVLRKVVTNLDDPAVD